MNLCQYINFSYDYLVSSIILLPWNLVQIESMVRGRCAENKNGILCKLFKRFIHICKFFVKNLCLLRINFVTVEDTVDYRYLEFAYLE